MEQELTTLQKLNELMHTLSNSRPKKGADN